MAIKKEKSQINLFQIIVIFLLGVLIASNIFVYVEINDLKSDLSMANKEIDKLKADDVAIAQAVNGLYSQLQNLGIIKSPADNN